MTRYKLEVEIETSLPINQNVSNLALASCLADHLFSGSLGEVTFDRATLTEVPR